MKSLKAKSSYTRVTITRKTLKAQQNSFIFSTCNAERVHIYYTCDMLLQPEDAIFTCLRVCSYRFTMRLL